MIGAEGEHAQPAGYGGESATGHGWMLDDHERAASPASANDHLDLTDRDRLPWLESDDDADEPGLEPRRTIGVAAGALALLVAIVGGVWFVSHRHAAPPASADGSLVSAPATPYKEAPKNPGGKTFDGTGDTSFAVSQGQSRPAHLADEPAPPEPQASPAAAKPATGAPAKGAAPAAKPAPVAEAPAPAGGVAQIGAYSTQALADAAWGRLSQQYDALKGVHHRVVQGQADIGTVYRLQAITGAGEAGGLCDKLRSGGLACQVKH